MNFTAELLFAVMVGWFAGNHAVGFFFWTVHPGICLQECLSGVNTVELPHAQNNPGSLLHQLRSVISPEERIEVFYCQLGSNKSVMVVVRHSVNQDIFLTCCDIMCPTDGKREEHYCKIQI